MLVNGTPRSVGFICQPVAIVGGERAVAQCGHKRYIGIVQIGTRELRNRLSHYLRRVRESREPIYVTDRGEVVAELRPVADAGEDDEAVLALAAAGELSLGNGRRFKSFKPIKPKRAVSLTGIVLEDRR
jgi:prevent-host-death family protein